jgi:hypothetical protein
MPLPPFHIRLCHLILLDLDSPAQHPLDDQRPGQGVADRQDRVGPRGYADARGGVFRPRCESARNLGGQGEECRGRLGDWRGWQICVQVSPSDVPCQAKVEPVQDPRPLLPVALEPGKDAAKRRWDQTREWFCSVIISRWPDRFRSTFSSITLCTTPRSSRLTACASFRTCQPTRRPRRSSCYTRSTSISGQWANGGAS